MSGTQPLLHDLAIALRAPTVVLSGRDGQLRSAGTQGVLHGDLRVLGEAVVTVNGREAEPIGFAEPGADRGEFTGLLRGIGDPGPDPTVWLRRHRTAGARGMYEELELASSASAPVRCAVELTLSADFAPIEEIKGGDSREAVPPVLDGSGVLWKSGGLTSRVVAEGAQFSLQDGKVVARWMVDAPTRLHWSVSVTDEAPLFVPGAPVLATPEVRADDRRFASFLNRSLADLTGLLLAEREHPDDVFAGAGAPWYLTLFGRDSLWAARLLLPVSVDLAAGTLRTLARSQGRKHDPATGEAPGKILHERRRADFKLRGMSLPAWYYGTIDATALWVCLLHDAWRWGLAEERVRELLPNLRAALTWITELADTDGDGFAEYLDETGRGLANQGWKDSRDAVRFADGRRAEPPVALSEVQGYQHEAVVRAADLLTALGEPADGLTDWAADLRTRFREKFWVNGFPALALDGAKTPVDALTSNIGHLLGTGLVDEAESATIAGHLLGPDLAAGYGLRTMSSIMDGYSPLSYHCGSVWPHDTAIVVNALSRAGHGPAAARLGAQLLTAAEAFGYRMPELYAGFGTDDSPIPLPYGASCRPQAWSAASAVVLLQTFLGLQVDAPAGTIKLSPPPSPVGAFEVRDLPVGNGTLSLSVAADGSIRDLVLPQGFRQVP
ncbi:amylo-alpha-1,6-glucosidase [Amycolatopsis magusensis]|uniref:amylo-alpha-1,6-glucosidase n=1 Tax=Amycolatopsis magusensis TaxID=882444 RepID=UPI0037920EAF